ncbi:MAG TPA: hypothetical protein VGJ05_22445 [Fimbriiglobus sp.]|jgi:hypothetical protein
MRLSLKVCCVLIVVGSLTSVGCESNNKGKIEGTKWTGELKESPGMWMRMEFATDGRLKMVISGQGVSKTITGKWKLSFGDYVEMSDLSEPLAGRTKHVEKISITGKTLVMTDTDVGGTSITFQKEI